MQRKVKKKQPSYGMKIAISVPDAVFREVKKAAEEQKRSRSEIFVEEAGAAVIAAI